MRWFALFALLANMLLAVWYFVIIQPAEKSMNRSPVAVLVEQQDLPEVRLLAELDEEKRAQEGIAPVAPVTRKVDQPAECLLVGPIPEKVTALQLKQRFEALGLDPDFRLFLVKQAPAYWVYLPPYASAEETRKVLKKLRAAGVDSFYVAEGELKGSISLGVFSQEPSAMQVRDERVAKGYPALIKAIPKSQPEIWAAFREVGGLADAGYWRELAVDFPGLGRRTVSCGAVASAEKLF